MNETLARFSKTLNEWGQQTTPFLFIVDFEMEKPLVWKLSEIKSDEIKFDIQGFTNSAVKKSQQASRPIERLEGKYEAYEKKFRFVHEKLNQGYSFLVNLTDKTKVSIDTSLTSLFEQSSARYKLLFKDEFLVFSPESFVQIRNGKIVSYPMKGTISAETLNAKEKILTDTKELAEHVTIVDLIRNDLSQVATDVSVNRFRYVEEIKTRGKNLLQVSSEIVGTLDSDYASKIGDIIIALLPAGSVSGAPKAKTLEIIREAEQEKRGYYTGVFGYFDGVNLDSGVMIRYIERKGQEFFYRSGGGITTQSDAKAEYQELIDKVYVPID